MVVRCLKNVLIWMFIKVHSSTLLINSKYLVEQEGKNRTCPVPSCYIALREEPLKNDAIHITSVILSSSTFARQGDKVEHCFEPVANHSAIKFVG